MTRREFFLALGTSAFAFLSFGHAQNSKKRLIGVLGGASPETAMPQAQALLAGLQDVGYIAGRDYEMVSKWAHGKNEILPELADALVRLNPDVLVAAPMPAVLALKALTNTIPITSFMLADEIRLGLVASDARPGGNVTGLDMRVDGLVGKQIELATRAVPGATTLVIIGVMTTTAFSSQSVMTLAYAGPETRRQINAPIMTAWTERIRSRASWGPGRSMSSMLALFRIML